MGAQFQYLLAHQQGRDDGYGVAFLSAVKREDLFWGIEMQIKRLE